MKLDLRELREVTVRLIDNLIESEGVESVDVNANFFWDMPPEILFDVSKNPEEFDIGSLEESWQFLRLIPEKNDGLATYMLTELAPLLRYIGEVCGGSFSGEGKLPEGNLDRD